MKFKFSLWGIILGIVVSISANLLLPMMGGQRPYGAIMLAAMIAFACCIIRSKATNLEFLACRFPQASSNWDKFMLEAATFFVITSAMMVYIIKGSF